MNINEAISQLPVSGASHTTTAVAVEPDFDVRWAAWIARGRVRERQTRRKLIVWAAVLAMAAAIVYVFLR
jgi:hypothetical protein